MFTRDRITNNPVRKKVSRKITFSNPLLVNEDELPQTRPNPVPFTCSKTTAERRMDIIICKTKNTVMLTIILLSNPIDKPGEEPD